VALMLWIGNRVEVFELSAHTSGDDHGKPAAVVDDSVRGTLRASSRTALRYLTRSERHDNQCPPCH
jgi:hypothetical protein